MPMRVGLVSATYYVYILANSANAVLYIGVTNDIVNRCQQHRQKQHSDSFTARYNVNKLVYYETFGDINLAIAREKQLKAGTRKKKVALIEENNPNWLDLFETDLGAEYI